MKVSELWHKVLAAVGGLVAVGSALRGDTVNVAGDGFFAKLASMIPAVFSRKDEQKLESILMKLDKIFIDPSHPLFGIKPGARQSIILFFQWHFQKRCAGERVISWWTQNELQKFIVELSKADDKDYTASIEFLTWMLETIHVGSENLQDGFTRLADQLEHVPHFPEGAHNLIRAINQMAGEAGRALTRHREHMQQVLRAEKDKKSWLDWLID